MNIKTNKNKRLQQYWRKISMAVIVLLALIFVVYAVKISNFDNQGSSFNIIFTGSENYTYNLTFYRYANFTSASLNLSGERTIESSYKSNTNFTNGAETCGGLVNNSFDGNWNTYGMFSYGTGVQCILYFNYSFNTHQNNLSTLYLNRSSRDPEADHNTTSEVTPIPLECLTSEPSFKITYRDEFVGLWTLNFNVTCWNYTSSQWSPSIFTHQTTDVNILNKLYETKMVFLNTTYPENISLSINQSQVFNFTEQFNQSNNKTLDFSSLLRNSTNSGACDCVGCYLDGANCTINFTFHSDTAGILQVSDVNINWLEYNNPNLTIEHPNETYNGITYVPLNFTAVDDWQLSYCFFNVTRGASLEVANTQITNCTNTTFVVSGSANYVLWMCINDTSGNENCTSSSFATTNYVPPPTTTTGPGGGGYVPEEPEEEVEASICDKTNEPLELAWTDFKKEMNWINFKKLWFAYWNYTLCKSGASIIPI